MPRGGSKETVPPIILDPYDCVKRPKSMSSLFIWIFHKERSIDILMNFLELKESLSFLTRKSNTVTKSMVNRKEKVSLALFA